MRAAPQEASAEGLRQSTSFILTRDLCDTKPRVQGVGLQDDTGDRRQTLEPK